MPGTGFDVVPSDCLALHLKERMADATSLELAFYGTGGGSSCVLLDRRRGQLRIRPRFVVSVDLGFVAVAGPAGARLEEIGLLRLAMFLVALGSNLITCEGTERFPRQNCRMGRWGRNGAPAGMLNLQMRGDPPRKRRYPV